MAYGLGDLLTSLQQGVQGINNLNITLGTVFARATTSSTGAPSAVGTITFTSSQASGFLLVTLSSGVTVKLPYYPQ